MWNHSTNSLVSLKVSLGSLSEIHAAVPALHGERTEKRHGDTVARGQRAASINRKAAIGIACTGVYSRERIIFTEPIQAFR